MPGTINCRARAREWFCWVYNRGDRPSITRVTSTARGHDLAVRNISVRVLRAWHRVAASGLICAVRSTLAHSNDGRPVEPGRACRRHVEIAVCCTEIRLGEDVCIPPVLCVRHWPRAGVHLAATNALKVLGIALARAHTGVTKLRSDCAASLMINICRATAAGRVAPSCNTLAVRTRADRRVREHRNSAVIWRANSGLLKLFRNAAAR